MMRTTLISMMAALALGGCAAGQQLKLDVEPEEMSDVGMGVVVSATVTDQRPYVVNNDKDPSFIGKYRGGFGNPFDVKTEGARPLARVVQVEVESELRSLGFTVSRDDVNRQLSVIIKDWNFDGFQDTRFWYAASVTVLDAEGQELVERYVSDEKTIEGDWMGARGGMEREIDELYAGFIHGMIRDNPDIMAALTN